MEYHRREFLKNMALTGVGIEAALSASLLLGASSPSLSIVHYKRSPAEAAGINEEAERLTRRAVEDLGGMRRFVAKGETVWVKPNIGWDRRPEQAATTNPDVVATLVRMCYEAGAVRVVVTDNPCNSARRTFPRSGIAEAAKKAGAKVFFMDRRKFRRMAIHGKVLKTWEVYQDAVEADKLINVAIVKQHSLSKATLGIKNLMGLVGGPRNRYHQNLTGTLPDLAAFFKPDLVVLDAVRVLRANGPSGGSLTDVVRKDTVIAGVDQVAVDAVGATFLGLKAAEIGHLAEAEKRGLGTTRFESLAPIRTEL